MGVTSNGAGDCITLQRMRGEVFLNLRILSLAAGLLIASVGAGWGVVSAERPDPIVLVSNTMTGASVNSSNFAQDRAQEFTTGNNPEGYTVTGVTLAFHLGNPGGNPVTYRVELWSLTDSGTADQKLGTFANPATLADHSNGGSYFAAPDGGFKLEPEERYLVLFEIVTPGTWDASIRTVSSNAEDASGEYTWAIHNDHRYRDRTQTGAGGSWMTHQQSLWLRVEGHEDRLAPTVSEVTESRSPSTLAHVGQFNRASSPCGFNQPGLGGNAGAFSNIQFLCDTRTGEWVRVQMAIPGVDYALETDLQPGNPETNGCAVGQKYDPIAKNCLTYAPGK